MKPNEIKPNLNKKVICKNAQAGIEAEYILTGAIFRRRGNEFYYQAELQDIKNGNSLLICSLDDVEAAELEEGHGTA